MYINGEKHTETIFFTVRWIAEDSGKTTEAVKKLLHNAGIKPVCKDAIYAYEALETAKLAPPRGRPKKAKPEAPAKKGKK